MLAVKLRLNILRVCIIFFLDEKETKNQGFPKLWKQLRRSRYILESLLTHKIVWN